MEVCSCGAYAPNTVLLKLNGTKCNLHCDYCSEIVKGRLGCMSLDVVTKLFLSLPNDADVILHGGEPLLDLILAKEVIDLHYELRGKRIGIQTNGCCPTGTIEMLSTVSDKIKLGVSIDGPESCNLYRKTGKGHPAFAVVDSFLEHARSRNIPVKCISTINNVNVQSPIQILDYFSTKEAVVSLRVNPCFDVQDNGLANYAVHPLKFLWFLKAATSHWLESKYYRNFKLEPILSALQSRFSPDEINGNLPCAKYVSFYPDGVCTLCDVLGNDTVERDLGNLFGHQNDGVPPSDCLTCINRVRCSGCPGILRRFAKNKELKSEYCEYRKEYFVFISQLRSILHFDNG